MPRKSKPATNTTATPASARSWWKGVIPAKWGLGYVRHHQAVTPPAAAATKSTKLKKLGAWLASRWKKTAQVMEKDWETTKRLCVPQGGVSPPLRLQVQHISDLSGITSVRDKDVHQKKCCHGPYCTTIIPCTLEVLNWFVRWDGCCKATRRSSYASASPPPPPSLCTCGR